jgi:Zn-dependent M32 family carboxypeptidase
MSQAYEELKQRYHDAHIVNRIHALLTWDERVMMPIASGEERADMHNLLSHIKTDSYLKHDDLVPLLNAAKQDMHLLPAWDQRNLQYMMDAHDDPPLDIVPNLRSDLRYAESQCRQIWPIAKTNNNWDLMAAPFGQLIYNRRVLNTALAAVRHEATPYDVSLNRYSRKINTRHFDSITSVLLPQLSTFLHQHGTTAMDAPEQAPIA